MVTPLTILLSKLALAVCIQTPAPNQQPENLGFEGSPFVVRFRTPTQEQRFVANPITEILRRMAHRAQQDVIVTSGFRSCSHNRKVRGVSRSAHLRGIAVDFKLVPSQHTPPNMRTTYTSRQLQRLAFEVGGHGAGAYCGNFSHVDLGSKRSWDWCRQSK